MAAGAFAAAQCGNDQVTPVDAGADGSPDGSPPSKDAKADVGASDAGADAFVPPAPPGRVFALVGMNTAGPIGALYKYDLTSLPAGDGGVDAGPQLTTGDDIVRAGDRLYVCSALAAVPPPKLVWFENLSTSVDGPNALQGDAARLAYSAKTDSLYALTSYTPEGGSSRLAAVARYDKGSTISAGSPPAATYELLVPFGAVDLAAGDDDRVYMVRGTQQGSEIVAIENASKPAGTSTPPLTIKAQPGFSCGGPVVDSGRIWVAGVTAKGPEVRGYDTGTFGPNASPVVPDLSALAWVRSFDARAGWLVVAGNGSSPQCPTIVVFTNSASLQSGATPLRVPYCEQQHDETTAIRAMPSRDSLFLSARGVYLEFLGPLANPGHYVVSTFHSDGAEYMYPGFVRIEPLEP